MSNSWLIYNHFRIILNKIYIPISKYFYLLTSDIDCGHLCSPFNGQVNYTTTTFMSEAIYTCNNDCGHISGDLTRYCTADGTWSGDMPVCSSNNILYICYACAHAHNMYLSLSLSLSLRYNL